MANKPWWVHHPAELKDEPTEKSQLVTFLADVEMRRIGNLNPECCFATESEAWDCVRKLLELQRDNALENLKKLANPEYVSPRGWAHRLPEMTRAQSQEDAELSLRIARKGLELCP